MKRIYHGTGIPVIWLLIAAAALCPPAAAQEASSDPAVWRKFVPASTTVHEVFLSRTPQIVIYGDGLIVFRSDELKSLHQQVRLIGEEMPLLFLMFQQSFGLPSLTNQWLENELPYARSIEEPYQDSDDRVTIWIGLHEPSSLHTFMPTALKARSVNDVIAPAWNGMYKLNTYLAGFSHPRAEPYLPSRVEIAVQKLPRYLSDQAAGAVDWPLDSVDLAEVKGKRPRGYRTLSGSDAQEAYRLLISHQAIRSGDQVYLVWARPLLVP